MTVAPSPVRAALLSASLVLGCGPATQASGPAVSVNGSTTVAPVVTEAAEALLEDRGLRVVVDTQGGSSGGIALLGEGRVDLGLSSKPLGDADRERYPEVDFRAVAVGYDAVALVVSTDVWEGGLRSLSRAEMQAVYEGRVSDWSEVGGAPGRIVLFDKEPGRGTWEVFATWLYGEAERAPTISHPRVGGNEETRNKVAGTRGALSQLSWAWCDGERVFALGLEGEDGAVVVPSPESVASGAYPMARPLFLLTDGVPAGGVREVVDFVLSADGQEIVRRHGYLALDDVLR